MESVVISYVLIYGPIPAFLRWNYTEVFSSVRWYIPVKINFKFIKSFVLFSHTVSRYYQNNLHATLVCFQNKEIIFTAYWISFYKKYQNTQNRSRSNSLFLFKMCLYQHLHFSIKIVEHVWRLLNRNVPQGSTSLPINLKLVSVRNSDNPIEKYDKTHRSKQFHT